MKYHVVLLVFTGGYLAQASRFVEEPSPVSWISPPTNRSRKLGGQAISIDHILIRRSFVLPKDDEGSIKRLLPRSSRGSPKPDRRERNRPPSRPRPASNVAAVAPLEQQHQQQSQNHLQSQDSMAHTLRGSAPPRIQIRPSPVNTPMNFRGRFGAFSQTMAIKIGRKKPAKADPITSPIAQMEIHPWLEPPSPPKPPKSPKSSKSPNSPQLAGSSQTPNSPNTMLEKERSWLQKGKWTAGTQPFHNNPFGMSGAYVTAAGEYEPPASPRASTPHPQRSVSPTESTFSSSSQSSGLDEPSSPPIRALQMAAFPAQYQNQPPQNRRPP